MNAKHFLLIIMSVLIICIGADKGALAEYVFLKDGAIVQGTVIVNRAASITIRKTNNEKLVIDKQKVLRILFSMKPLARVYLQKKDGKGFEAYIVDEDRNHYTLREDLYRPVEFKVNRNDVLFVSDKNPSVLQGVPKEKQIVLSWYAPINHVKEYRIYLRQNQRAKYQLIGTSNINSYLVRGLKSKTTYYLKVTAVDDKNVESIPSNECMITTKNIPPQKPAGLTIRNVITKNNVLTIQLNWEKATDADGSVTQYYIYEKGRQGYVKTGRTASLNYAVNGLDPGPNSTYHFAVRAVDDTGSESADAFVSSRVKNDLNISITGDYIVPLAQIISLTVAQGVMVKDTPETVLELSGKRIIPVVQMITR